MNKKIKFNAQTPIEVGSVVSYDGKTISITSCRKGTHWHTDFQGRRHSPIQVYKITATIL